MQNFFSKELLRWYKINQRNHPWKQEPDPYKIWLSEIIMQQTRVEQGTPYYIKFVSQYPTVKHLANAPLDEVLKLWEGLGYYSRARNLHHTAKTIVKTFGSQFPVDYKDILSLKGIGKYTASAIASFAYKQPHAVVDGNVSRVLSRFLGVFEPIDSLAGKKTIEELAYNYLDNENPDLYNQAIMDFGAIVCKPANPMCDECPLSINCFAFNREKVKELPIKAGKIQKKKRKMDFLVIFDDNKTIIQQRNQDDIWKALYQFPEIKESKSIISDIQKHLKEENLKLLNLEVKDNYKQILTHQYIQADFYLCRVENISPLSNSNYIVIEKTRLTDFAYPKIIRNFLKDNFFMLFSILNFML